MRNFLCCAAIMALQGCAAIQALLPVGISCVPKDAPRMPPVMPNGELARLVDDVLVLTIAAERLDLLRYGKQAEAVIEGCR